MALGNLLLILLCIYPTKRVLLAHSANAKLKAAKVAADVHGVKGVENNLEVKPM
jgi:hypothetical protein